MKTRRPTFLTLHIILPIIAGVLTLYFSTIFVQVEGKAKTQDMEKSIGKMEKKSDVPTLNKKNNLFSEYQVIVDRNLFRPLGWGGEKPNNPFRLVGTVIESSSFGWESRGFSSEARERATSQKAKAIMTQGENPETFFVSEGDIIGNGYKVEEISANKVKLANAEKGENFVMQLSWNPLGGQISKEKDGKSKELSRKSSSSVAKGVPSKSGRPRPANSRRDMIRQMLEKRGFSAKDIEYIMNHPEKLAWAEKELDGKQEDDKSKDSDMESKLDDKNEGNKSESFDSGYK